MPKKFNVLTRPNIRKLEPGDKLIEHNIIFERLADGDGRYSVNVRVDGKRVHRVIGLESEGKTRTHAEEFIETAKTDARRGQLNLPAGRKIPLGFKEAADKYLARLKQSNGKNIVAKERHLRMYLVPAFGNRPLVSLSTFDVEKYKHDRLQPRKDPDTGKIIKATNGTVNRELATLSHFLCRAQEWGWIQNKPAYIKRLKEEPTKIIYLTPSQAQRLLEAAKDDDNPQMFLYCLIGLETGARMSEILSLKIADINLDNKTFYIWKSKTGARTQPITNNLASHLAEYIKRQCKDGQKWLFPSIGTRKSKTGYTTNIRSAWDRIIKAAKLGDDVVRHTLRHTAVTMLVQAGVDITTVKKISGHKTSQMVERYAHANNDHIREAMDKLEGKYKTSAAMEQEWNRNEKRVPTLKG